MFDFERPNIEVAEISEDKKYGKFVVEPLERGYGITPVSYTHLVIFAQSILQIPIIISQLTGYKGTGPWAYILRGLNSSYWLSLIHI